MLNTFDQFTDLPEDIINVIIYFIRNKVYDLCLVNKYFNDNSKKIKILSNKKYSGLSDENLKELVNLKSLYLDYQLITNEGIKNLNNLRSLKINENNIIIDESSIKILTNLTSLKINYNQIITDDSIKNLLKLKHLDISGCNIKDKTINELTLLTYLDIGSSNFVADGNIKYLTNLTNLRSLILSLNDNDK
jgi:Leucine-rich repeat (LRR) protein